MRCQALWSRCQALIRRAPIRRRRRCQAPIRASRWTRPRRRQQGYLLLIALFVLIITMAMSTALAAALMLRMERLERQQSNLQLTALLDAALARSLAELSDHPGWQGTGGEIPFGDGTYAANCLLARRLAERGVRFIQVYHRAWDHHGGVFGGITNKTKRLNHVFSRVLLVQDRQHAIAKRLDCANDEQTAGRAHLIRARADVAPRSLD